MTTLEEVPLVPDTHSDDRVRNTLALSFSDPYSSSFSVVHAIHPAQSSVGWRPISAGHQESAMSLKYAIALAACFALASAARADRNDAQATMSKADFDVVRSRMIGQLDSNRYAEITPEDKAAVIAALNRIDQRLAKSTMGDQDRLDIINDQELINQITTHASAESRMYCEREMLTGSHITKVACMSWAKWVQRQKDGQTAMTNLYYNHRSICPGCITDAPSGGH
jgi:hypothetical protein